MPHCWKSHVAAIVIVVHDFYISFLNKNFRCGQQLSESKHSIANLGEHKLESGEGRQRYKEQHKR